MPTSGQSVAEQTEPLLHIPLTPICNFNGPQPELVSRVPASPSSSLWDPSRQSSGAQRMHYGSATAVRPCRPWSSGGWVPCNPAPEAQLASAQKCLPLCQHGCPPHRPREGTQSGRSEQRQEQHQQQMQQHPAPQLPLDRAVADDLIDVLEACGSHPQQAQWAARLGAGRRFLPRQAAQGPMVAPVAWQLDVWSLQSIHWQGHASTGQLPFLLLYRPRPASDHQPLVHHMPCRSHSH